MTYSTGAKSAPAAAAAYAAYLTEGCGAPADQMGLSEYYLRGQGAAEAAAAGMAAVPTLRRDIHPELAAALGVEDGQLIDTRSLANILAGYAADGSDLPGSQHDVRGYKAPGASHNGDPPLADGEEPEEGKARQRIAYYDFTFSAPKSVSLAWAFAGTEAERASILQAHHIARDEALRYMGQEIARAHMGHGREDRTTEAADIAWISVDHFAARPTVAITRPDPTTGVVATELYAVPASNGLLPGDPQLHSHCVVPNIMRTASGRMVALNGNLLNGRIHEFGAVYQAILTRELRTLGIDVVLDAKTKTAKLWAIPGKAVDEFSKRTRDAEATAKNHFEEANPGQSWADLGADQQVAWLKGGAGASRRSKVDDMGQFAAWITQAARIGWKHTTAIAYGPTMKPRDREERLEAGLHATDPLFAAELDKRAVVKGMDARLAAARGLIAEGMDTVADVSAITRAMATRGVMQAGRLTKLLWREENGRATKITTELHRDQELELMDLAFRAKGDASHQLAAGAVGHAAAELGIDFTGPVGERQREIAEQMGQGGAVGAFIGVAGVGKTSRILPPLVKALTAAERDVWGVAVGWKQARALGEAGITGFRQRALQPFLEGLDNGQTKLTAASVVVVDELSLVGTRQLLELMRHRNAIGFKLVMTGDEKQCQAVEAGPVIDLLRQALGRDAIPEILTTVRQWSEVERETATMFRDGKAAEAIDRKRADGTAELVPGGYSAAVKRIAELAQARRQENASRDGYTVTISAPTNSDAHNIGMAVRELRRQAGEITGEDHAEPATDGAGNAYSLPLAAGDRVRLFAVTRAIFTSEDGRNRSSNIGDNGTVLDVVEVRPGDGLRLRNPESGKVGFVGFDALRDKGSGRIKLASGEALTVHNSQGLTSDEHISAMPGGSAAVQGFLAYVAASRHRIANHIVGSMGAEMRELDARRSNGQAIPGDPEAAAWANLSANLARQPVKDSAIAFLTGAAAQATRAAKALQAGLRPQEARAAAGKAATTLRNTFDMPKAAAALGALTARLEEAMTARAPLLAQLRRIVPAPTAEDRMKGTGRELIRIYARSITAGTAEYSEAQNAIVGAMIEQRDRGLPHDPVHGLPVRPAGHVVEVEQIEAWVEPRLGASIDAYREYGERGLWVRSAGKTAPPAPAAPVRKVAARMPPPLARQKPRQGPRASA